MKSIGWFSLLLVGVGVGACAGDAERTTGAGQASSVADSAPRGKYVPPPDEEQPLNDRCFVCHDTYQKEGLTEMHAKGGVGCETCHGASDAHCSDENNVTPPDIMYPRAKVNEFCAAECHEDWFERSDEHAVVADKAEEESPYCTDCHGQHRLKSRRVEWNKVTRELIE